jgi:hypothetical protein
VTTHGQAPDRAAGPRIQARHVPVRAEYAHGTVRVYREVCCQPRREAGLDTGSRHRPQLPPGSGAQRGHAAAADGEDAAAHPRQRQVTRRVIAERPAPQQRAGRRAHPDSRTHTIWMRTQTRRDIHGSRRNATQPVSGFTRRAVLGVRRPRSKRGKLTADDASRQGTGQIVDDLFRFVHVAEGQPDSAAVNSDARQAGIVVFEVGEQGALLDQRVRGPEV